MSTKDFYRAFEEKHRGSRELIKERVSIYLPFVLPLKNLYPNMTSLDIGCGRGEWLELLKDNNILSQGIDLDEGMLEACHILDLNVQKGEGIAYLKAQKDESMSLITAFHVVEHISFEELQELTQEALRVLTPGGILIMETPNPENIKVATENFYLDPTHIKPIPSELLSFLTNFYGYTRTKVLRLQESKELIKQENINLVQVIEGASPDYAVIAQKKADDNILKHFDSIFKKDFGLSLNTLAEKFEHRLSKIETNANEAKLTAEAAKVKAHEAQTKANESEFKANEAQAKANESELKVHEAEVRAHEAWHHYHTLENSNSWKMTKPLRIIGKGARWFVIGIKHWVTFSPTSRPRRVSKKTLIALKNYIHHHPKLKTKLLHILQHFPQIREKFRTIQLDIIHAPMNSQQRDEDFDDIYQRIDTSFKQKSLLQRDIYLPEKVIYKNINKLVIDGHFDGTYSLASVNRNIVHRLLDNDTNIDIFIKPRENEPKESITSIPNGNTELKLLNNLIVKKTSYSEDSKTIKLYHHYPLVKNTNKEKESPIALFFWEESQIPFEMIDTLNNAYIGLIVTSWFTKKALMDSGCLLPIHIIALPLQKSIFSQNSNIEDLTRCKKNNFINILHVSSCFPRKGIDILLQSFNTLFKTLGNVKLTIKTFHNPHNNVEQLIKELIDEKYYHKIHLIFEEYTDQQMTDLYSNTDIVVLPTRGEGLNMPAIESCAHNRPLIVTGFGAHTDFLVDNPWMVPYRFEQTSSHFNSTSSVWATPSHKFLTQQLVKLSNQLLTGESTVKDNILKLNENINSVFYSKNSVKSLLSALTRIKQFNNKHSSFISHKIENLSIITTWEIECGIAEYSKYIVNELLSHKINTEIIRSTDEYTPILTNEFLTVKKGFTQNTELNLSKLSINGNSIWIQHHFAFFPLSSNLSNDIKTFLSKGKNCYITLHTTKPLLNFDTKVQKEAINCLNEFNRVFVHSTDDLNNLKRLGLVENITLIPQGVEVTNIHKKQKTKHDIYYIGSFGFLFPHKGIQKLIQAFALLIKNKQTKNIKLRLVNTVKNDIVSQDEFKECQRLIHELNVSEHVEWHTDFLSKDEVKILLSDIDLLILPYQYTEESSSAASRMALSICENVATTPAPIFDEIRDATHNIDDFNVDAIYKTMHQFFTQTDYSASNQIHIKREKWINQHNWTNIVEQYVNIFQSITINNSFLKESNE